MEEEAAAAEAARHPPVDHPLADRHPSADEGHLPSADHLQGSHPRAGLHENLHPSAGHRRLSHAADRLASRPAALNFEHRDR